MLQGAIVSRFCVVTNVCLSSHVQTSERCCEIMISRNKWAIIVNMPISYRTIADKKVPRQQRFDLDALHLFHNTLVNSVITFGRIFSRVIRVEEKLRFAFFSLSFSPIISPILVVVTPRIIYVIHSANIGEPCRKASA